MQTVDVQKVEKYISEALVNELDQAGFVKSISSKKVDDKTYVLEAQVVLENPQLVPCSSRFAQMNELPLRRTQWTCTYVAEPIDCGKVRVVWKSIEKTETLDR
ncbi:MAG: hypothetical protein DRP09_15525 [Candidatus Thorarchaeota archaeon]|nr:MAG: hypothetical protein DRP09_15525 [Candidatus Thorarchaeota archaeon]